MQLKNLIFVFAFFATSAFCVPAPAADPLFGNKFAEDVKELKSIIDIILFIYFTHLPNYCIFYIIH